jgi:hypothetical protein
MNVQRLVWHRCESPIWKIVCAVSFAAARCSRFESCPFHENYALCGISLALRYFDRVQTSYRRKTTIMSRCLVIVPLNDYVVHDVTSRREAKNSLFSCTCDF